MSADEVYENHGFLIEDNRILSVVPNDRITGTWDEDGVMDCSGRIVCPGFINAHMHQYGILSRGFPVMGAVVDFDTFLGNYWWPYMENRIRFKAVEITTKASAAELIHSGVTGFCDTLEAPFCESDTLIRQGEILEELGIRGIVSLESCQRISEANGQSCLSENGRAAEYFKKKRGLVEGAVCTHTTFTCNDGFIRRAWELAESIGVMYQFHLSESRHEPEKAAFRNLRPAWIYGIQGVLGPRTLASQCVKLDASEISLLAENKVKTVHMPLSNCEVGGGIAPVVSMLKEGLTVGLGTDGYINDFFAVMKAAFLIHKAALEKTEVMPAAEVFRMATEYGAQCLGWKGCGKLSPGFSADFIALKDEFLTPVTRKNIFDQIVVHGKKDYVDRVVVNGRILADGGVLLNMDEEKINGRMREFAKEFREGAV
ncbi:MAG: amidohydrolase family protein [Lacrimispora sp.]